MGDFPTIDPLTGAPAVIATLDGTLDTAIGGLACDDNGTLYGARKLGWGGPPCDLIIINTTTGHITSIGTITYMDSPVDYFDSIAFSPPIAPPPPPVGGEVYPVNKVSLLAPWLGLALLLAAGGGILVMRRRRA